MSGARRVELFEDDDPMPGESGLRLERIPRPEIRWLDMNRRFLNPGEMETLVQLAREANACATLEIGCNAGRTSRLLLENVPTITRAIGIDVPPGYEFAKSVQRNEVPQRPGEFALQSDRFELRLTRYGSKYMRASDFPPLDFIFVDGDHGADMVERDSKLARACIRPGGIIAWHDYHERGNVDVKACLDRQRADGHDIRLAAGTWIAFERF